MKYSCKPLPSLPMKYNKTHQFLHPILLHDLIEHLNLLDYKIENQILNYQGKVVGLYINNNDETTGYVPCYPSGIDNKYDYVFMNDVTLYTTYERTIRFLTRLKEESNGDIPCKPDYLVVEDDHVVVMNVSEELPRLDNYNYVFNKNLPMKTTDMVTLNNVYRDSERILYINKLKLETNFYNVFRNTIRLIINDTKNNINKNKLMDIVNNAPYMLYLTKLEKVISILKEITTNLVSFSDTYDPNLLNEISLCINKNDDKCDDQAPVCSINKINNQCMLVLPTYNLLDSSITNSELYFSKMADELIRYTRIKSFIFQPQTYLSFGKLGYNLKNDEIILVQSLLTKEYFTGLVPKKMNPYVKNNTYDTMNPLETQKYDNEYIVENGKVIIDKDAKTPKNNMAKKIQKKIRVVD